jgi:hypothetical protein
MNPWLAIWNRPKATILQIIEENPKKGLWIFSSLFGLVHLLHLSQLYMVSEKISSPLLMLLILPLAPVWGYLLFSSAAYVIYRVGEMMKGKGDFLKCRAAIAWASFPYAASLLSWVGLYAIYGNHLFSSYPAGTQLGPEEIIVTTFFLMIQVGAFVYSLMLWIHALAAVQDFSPAKAIVNIVIALFFVLFLVFIFYISAMVLWFKLA